MFLVRLPLLGSVGRVLREQFAGPKDHFDPVMEGMGKRCHEALKRPFLELAVGIETVFGNVAEIGFGLLHYGHVAKHSALAHLLVRAEPSDASRRRRDDRSRLLVEHALTIRARSYVDCVL